MLSPHDRDRRIDVAKLFYRSAWMDRPIGMDVRQDWQHLDWADRLEPSGLVTADCALKDGGQDVGQLVDGRDVGHATGMTGDVSGVQSDQVGFLQLDWIVA